MTNEEQIQPPPAYPSFLVLLKHKEFQIATVKIITKGKYIAALHVTSWIWIQEISTYEVLFQECVSWKTSSFFLFSKQLSFLK